MAGMPNEPPATSAPAPADPPQDRTGGALPERIGFLFYLTRLLLGFGCHLRATLERRAAAENFSAIAVCFGTANLSVILAGNKAGPDEEGEPVMTRRSRRS